MKVIVIGAGASGLMAAVTAARKGHEVRILEKNGIMGKKLFITGKGRCNVTNEADISEFFPMVMRNREFLYSAFYTYSNLNLMEELEKGRVKLKTERGRRVFPESDKSSDIIRYFQRELEYNEVRIEYNTEVIDIIMEKNDTISLKTNKGNFNTEHLIVAAGGASYPLTGSDGKVLEIIKKMGITTHPFKGSLVPLVLKEKVSHLAGLSLKNVTFSLFNGKGKKVFDELGELLFTHDGVSGPTVLSASSLYDGGEVACSIDLKPGLDEIELDKRIQRDFLKYQNKNLENALKDLSLNKMVMEVIEKTGIDPDNKVNSITREERLRLVRTFKDLRYTVIKTRPIAEAIVSKGGVEVKEIDPSTMKLKKYPDISICGEIIDVDALTGGYNLQIAFSTGFVAGNEI